MEITPKKSLYLRGLQAAHSGVLEIVDTVFHIAMYRFCKVRSSWERMEVEGSAYVTRNGTAPFHSFIVLNKKGKLSTNPLFLFPSPYIVSSVRFNRRWRLHFAH